VVLPEMPTCPQFAIESRAATVTKEEGDNAKKEENFEI